MRDIFREGVIVFLDPGRRSNLRSWAEAAVVAAAPRSLARSLRCHQQTSSDKTARVSTGLGLPKTTRFLKLSNNGFLSRLQIFLSGFVQSVLT